jgi:hypothetical protein
LVHVGEQRPRRHAGSRCDADDAARQLRGITVVRHERANADLTSITRASSPAASFFDRIEAVMSGMLSTVAVTSRTP